ncbi:thiol:disulfide interchange protein DsbG [Allopusillimonas soli]|nr:thiol:disulfide interchange protein DsbG [Allopusillimonas soli]
MRRNTNAAAPFSGKCYKCVMATQRENPMLTRNRGHAARQGHWRRTGLPALALAVALSASPSWAETYPTVIQDAVAKGVKVVTTFPAASGLKGWVLQQDDTYSIVYTTSDNKTLLAGTLIDEHGEDLTAQYEAQYVPKPDVASLYAQLADTGYIQEGTADNPARTLYIFVDGNCPYCHYTWIALQAYQKVGLQVRWIFVDTLGPTSMPKALQVLSADDPAAAFRNLEENFGKP